MLYCKCLSVPSVATEFIAEFIAYLESAVTIAAINESFEPF